MRQYLAVAVLPLALAAASSGHAAAPAYTLVATTPLPAMPEGDFDQLDADVGRNRLYVSAEDGAAIDVFDLTTGALLQSGGDVKSPHKIAVDVRDNRLFVADGADAAVKVLGPDLHTIARIATGPHPDTGVLDPVARIFYVSSRDGTGDDANSMISAISLDSLKVIASLAVPARTLKGLILDRAGHRLLVSMRDKDRIGVIDLQTGHFDSWSAGELHKPVPLAFDPATNQVFAGSRNPASLVVLDARDGRVRANLPATETSDSLAFDPGSRVLYLSGDSGMSSYCVARNGSVRFISTDPALVGKTSLYVRQSHRLYVMRPRKGTQVAALQIYATTDACKTGHR